MLYNSGIGEKAFSVMGLGCWNFGGQWNKVSETNAIEIIRYGIDHGINFVDVAESYGIPDGECEILLGKALQDGYREKVFLISKVGWYGRRTSNHFYAKPSAYDKLMRKLYNRLNHFKSVDLEKRTPELIRLCGQACCGRLKTDYIDLLLCHDGAANDIPAFIEGFKWLKKEGFIKYYGISTDSIDKLKEFYDYSEGECAAVECDYSLLNRTAESKLFPFCETHGIKVFTRGTLASGLLSGKYDLLTTFKEPSRLSWNEGGKSRAQYIRKINQIEKIKAVIGNEPLPDVSYKYAFSQYKNISVVFGCTSIEQMKNNINIGDSYLDENILLALNKQRL
jgi:aryl-alcohol dehydrogenase-like predicted oxidoreductase